MKLPNVWQFQIKHSSNPPKAKPEWPLVLWAMLIWFSLEIITSFGTFRGGLINGLSQICRCTQSGKTAFPHASLLCWGNKALLPFGEVGLASSLDMVFKEAVDLVYMNTSRGFTPISSLTTIEVSFSSLAVHLLKYLPI